VDLTLTGGNDPQLRALTECMREETVEGYKGWYRLNYLMIKLGNFNKAEELYETLLDQTTDERKKAHFYHMLGVIKSDQGEYAEAIRFYEKSLKIEQKIFSPTDPDLAPSYDNIGSVYGEMREYSKVLRYYEKALEIYKKSLPANHPLLATSYNNMSWAYRKMGDFSKALSYYECALDIVQRSLPPNHPHLQNVRESIEICTK
jgi:tetratricopeptide (TPR) repeat protein